MRARAWHPLHTTSFHFSGDCLVFSPGGKVGEVERVGRSPPFVFFPPAAQHAANDVGPPLRRPPHVG